MNDFYLFAEIKSVINEKGFVLAKSFSDFPKRFKDLFFLFIDIFGDKRKLTVESFDFIDDKIILKFKNFDSDEDVRIFCGKKLYLNYDVRRKLNKNEYLIKDLLGCKIKFGDKFFGNLIDVIQLESNDVYVLLSKNNKEILLPALKEYIRNVDVEKKEIELTKSIEEIFE